MKAVFRRIAFAPHPSSQGKASLLHVEQAAGRGVAGSAPAVAASDLLQESAVEAELLEVSSRWSSVGWALRLPRRLARQGKGRRTELPTAAAPTLGQRMLGMAKMMATHVTPVVAVPLGVLLGWQYLDSFTLGWSEGRM
jgi:hypothetical protein